MFLVCFCSWGGRGGAVTARRTNQPKMHAKMHLYSYPGGRELHFWRQGGLTCRVYTALQLCSISLVIFQLDRGWCICLCDYTVDWLTSAWVWLLSLFKLTNPWPSKISVRSELLLYIQTPTLNIIIKVSLCTWCKMALYLVKDACG